MSEVVKMVESLSLVCDGCGYLIGRDSEHFVLTVKLKGADAYDLHFHVPALQGDKRSWGTRDCLGYWHKNIAARAESTGTDGLRDEGAGEAR